MPLPSHNFGYSQSQSWKFKIKSHTWFGLMPFKLFTSWKAFVGTNFNAFLIAALIPNNCAVVGSSGVAGLLKLLDYLN